MEYAHKNPIKIKAHQYANKNKLIGDRCIICGLTTNLHFHHTNYVENIGVTLCRTHHYEMHTAK